MYWLAVLQVFVSIKGFYYQAEIQGEMVTWLVPHQFAQHVSDVMTKLSMMSNGCASPTY